MDYLREATETELRRVKNVKSKKRTWGGLALFGAWLLLGWTFRHDAGEFWFLVITVALFLLWEIFEEQMNQSTLLEQIVVQQREHLDRLRHRFPVEL